MKPSCSISKEEPKGFVQFNLNCNKKHIGHISLALEGDRLLVVDDVDIEKPFRRQGFATKLYETAARYACEEERVLASYYRLEGARSTDFWEKQVAKGRALRHPGAGYEGQDAYSLIPSKACAADLSALELPKRWPWLAAAGAAALFLLTRGDS